MTEWGLIAATGIPTSAIICFGLGIYWERLKAEPEQKSSKQPTHEIIFLAERERRMRK